MSKDVFIEKLRNRFGEQPFVSREELFDFYKSYEPNLNESTFGWRIYSLKEKKIIKTVKTGLYTLSVKPQFHPVIETKLKDIATKLSKQFPLAKYCVWNTKWLNEWMVHQPGKFLLIVEIEVNAVESAFYFLKDGGYKNVFLSQDDNLLEHYIYEERETIIVKSLVTKSPLKKDKKIFVPSVEKILGDLFIDKKTFSPFQGGELVNIFNYVFEHYELNITKLLAYSKRRTKEQDLLEFITKHTKLNEIIRE